MSSVHGSYLEPQCKEAGHVQHIAASAGLALQIFENPYYKEGAELRVRAFLARVEGFPSKSRAPGFQGLFAYILRV